MIPASDLFIYGATIVWILVGLMLTGVGLRVMTLAKPHAEQWNNLVRGLFIYGGYTIMLMVYFEVLARLAS